MSTTEWRQANPDKMKQYRRDWYNRNKDAAKARVLQRRKELRDWLNEYKSNLRCDTCGEDHIGCLEFHHEDADQKELTVSQAVHLGYSRERIMEEIAKCKVLCANCHRKLHWEHRCVV